MPYATLQVIDTIKHDLQIGFTTRDFGTTKEEIEEMWESGDEPVSNLNPLTVINQIPSELPVWTCLNNKHRMTDPVEVISMVTKHSNDRKLKSKTAMSKVSNASKESGSSKYSQMVGATIINKVNVMYKTESNKFDSISPLLPHKKEPLLAQKKEKKLSNFNSRKNSN